MIFRILIAQLAFFTMCCIAKEYVVLNEDLYSGFGAEFSAVIGALDSFEKGEISGLEVALTSGLYFDPAIGPNWWNYYFAPINVGNKNDFPHYHTNVQDCCRYSNKAYNELSRQQNFEIIQKYVQVNPSIQKDVNSYVNKNFKRNYVIGVHHRGTDKIMEVSLVPYELTLAVLQHTITQLPKKKLKKLKIYVATDDQNFLRYLQEHYPQYVIYGDFFRSSDSQPLHSYESQYYSNNFEKGKEALVEALILSKCDALIRPAPSGFSWIPMVFNPSMPVNSIYCGGWEFPGNWNPELKF